MPDPNPPRDLPAPASADAGGETFFPDEQMALESVEAGRVNRKMRARGGSLMMVEVFFETGAVGAEHRHPHEQMSYVLAGEFVFTIDGQQRTIRAGDSLYVPSQALHGTRCVQAGRLLDVFTPQRQDFLANPPPAGEHP